MAAIPRPEVVSAVVDSVRFGFYSDDEVRKLSVKKITSPVTFDNHKNPVPNGLYDPALGPVEQLGSCATCNLGYLQCPGHFGHIELPVPVYNPLVFAVMFKMLRATCLHCFHLRVPETEVDFFRRKARLLLKGKAVEAMSLVRASAKQAGKKVAGEDLGIEDGYVEREDESDIEDADGPQSVLGSASSQKGPRMTTHTQQSIRALLNELLAAVPAANKCGNCRAHCPGLRQDGHRKVFLTPLPANKAAANKAQGTALSNVLEILKESAAGATRELEEAEMQRQTEEGSDAGEREDEGTEENEGSEEDEETEGSEPRDGGRGQQVASGPTKDMEEGDKRKPKYMTPSEVEEILRLLWQKEWRTLRLFFLDSPQKDPRRGYQAFFLRAVPVAPNKFRPLQHVGSDVYEHSQNTSLVRALRAALDLAELGSANLGQSVLKWLELQTAVNNLIDSTTGDNAGAPGIRQQLEKKEGLFRMNMMGKRVNFAARSVISPDVYLSPGEIGVPPYFAKKLSFPERVTPHNVARLRELVMRGPHDYPGAVAVEDERGRIVSLERLPLEKREALAKRLLGGHEGGKGGNKVDRGRTQVVYRQLIDGDLMLTNRQPTLHKPGLMAHRARVLRGEKTIRMHYANCSTFNADFDGDEINLHLPQDHLARAEGYHIVHADHQYTVPTDGKPIRGLIQDHISGGVLLTRKDTFLTRAEFMQLVYTACAPTRPGLTDPDAFTVPPPAVFKPRPLWTGKQVLTSVLAWLTRGMPPLTMSSGAKVPASYWGKSSLESTFEIVEGELVTGTVDKAQYGTHGLIHAVHELYGDEAAGKLLACFSRLFTGFVQTHGFTCGLDDTLVVPEAESAREVLLRQAEAIASAASAQLAGDADASIDRVMRKDGTIDQAGVEKMEAEARKILEDRYRSDFQGTGASHDAKVSGSMHPLSSSVIKACLPDGQLKPFRHNMLSLMTVTGAKGSLVNFSQISCLLGQQELEGRRTPRMASGKTLPCFRPFDAGARAGGFIADRFLTGLRPQEYYFHCMAGRDGLVDTAVKTARSGYLQRCLIKNLEGLRLHYDSTVRDAADGSIVQFMYGDDGSDVTRVSYLKQFSFLAKNAARVAQHLGLEASERTSKVAGTSEVENKIIKARSKRLKLLLKGKGHEADEALPVQGTFPPTVLGCLPEGLSDALHRFVQGEGAEILKGGAGKKKGRKGTDKSAIGPDDFVKLMELKYLLGLADPGEAVGVIAGQSLGEPSTQMTLNTFHMAGRGEANVTLGIPRLREILMTAAMQCKTPTMTLSLLPDLGRPEALALANRLRKLRLAEVLESMTVEETPFARARVSGSTSPFGRLYKITLLFYPEERFPEGSHLSWGELESTFRETFLPKLSQAVKLELKRLAAAKDVVMDVQNATGGGGDGEDGEEEEEAADDGKKKKKEKDDDDDENDEEEGKRNWKSTAEMKTYEGMDEEDMAAAEEAERMEEGEDTAAAGKGAGRGAEKDAKKEGQGTKKTAVEGVSGRASKRERKCVVEVVLPIDAPKVLLMEVAERVAVQSCVRVTAGIDRVFVLEGDAGGPPRVQTDGLNLEAAWMAPEVDANAIRTNDIGSMLTHYGVEAARATIVEEVKSVFKAYGIAVDPRHLYLIADYMTFQGAYRPMNRIGIDSSPSPFLKMSFETAAKFLTDATIKGATDLLQTPSSALVLGKVAPVGTGCTEIMQRLDV